VILSQNGDISSPQQWKTHKNTAYICYAAAAFLSLLYPWKMFMHHGASLLSAFSELNQKARSGTNRLELASREG
jgi:hypothetical protein